MKRFKKSFSFASGQTDNVKKRMLQWADQRSILLFLDTNHYRHTSGRYECICAVDAVEVLGSIPAGATSPDWWFGHIGYDYKNQLEQLESQHLQHFRFPDIFFFRPAIICYILHDETQLCIETTGIDPQEVWDAINEVTPGQDSLYPDQPPRFSKRMDREQYLRQLALVKEHIRQGDCYELNFCNEAYCTTVIHPRAVFEKLNALSPAPFAAYYKWEDQYLICSSPERYLCKEGATVIAQPIKGTAPRGLDPAMDKAYMDQLSRSVKERAEHVMIVDLMRNDLARFCRPGSICVDDLYGIHSFPRVHQMISTVQGLILEGFHWTDAIRHSFPMGSMTGAPKVMVMQLIDRYERSRRELFSGAVGYIDPDGDFDFNVVIRSLFYNARSSYLAYQTGGAITWDSDPEQEWEETLLKAAALEQVFR